MSSSHPARIESSASRIVTLEPRSARSEANSHPTTPPPITDHRRRELLEVEELVGGHDPAPVHLEAGQDVRHRARPPAPRCGPRRPGRRPRRRSPRPGGPPSGCPVPERVVTLRPLSRPARPLKSLSTTAFLRSWLTAKSTETLETSMPNSLDALDRPVDGSRLEEFLGRDAATVQAGAADLVPLDDGDRQTRRRTVERRGVAARAAADHDDVELVLAGHRPSSSCVRTTSARRARPPRNIPIAPAGAVSAPARVPLQPTVRTSATQARPPASGVSRWSPRPQSAAMGGELVDPIVPAVARVALHPAEADRRRRRERKLEQGLPQVTVRHRLVLRVLPVAA